MSNSKVSDTNTLLLQLEKKNDCWDCSSNDIVLIIYTVPLRLDRTKFNAAAPFRKRIMHLENYV